MLSFQTERSLKKKFTEENRNNGFADNMEKICANFTETIENLDKMKQYKFYFPDNNFDDLLKSMRKRKGSFKKTLSPFSRRKKIKK